MSKTTKKAFSLIELSVMIIIVSLLISGVIDGRSLIKDSRVYSARAVTFSSQIITIPKMVLWLESSVKDSFLTSQTIDGSQITSWYNREPAKFLVKNNLTTTASDNVIYKESSINNIPSANMTEAGNMNLTNFSNSALASSTIIVVFKPTTTVSATALNIIDSGDADNSTSSIAIKSNKVVLNAGSLVETSTITNPASFTKSSNYILMVYFNGASSKVFVNDIVEVGGSGASLDAGSNALNGLTVGANKSGASGIAAEIAEVIVYGRVLKNSEKRDVMSYLSKKYKIAVSGI